jgi:hypothetical protein
MKRHTAGLAVILVFLFLFIFNAQAMIQYDDFSGMSIDKDRWRDLEFIQKIDNQQLLLKVTAVERRSNGLFLNNAFSINYIRANVTIKNLQSEFNSPSDISPRAYLGGFFF